MNLSHQLWNSQKYIDSFLYSQTYFTFLIYFLLLLLFHVDKNNKSIFNMGFWKVWGKKQIIREIQEFQESSVSLF